MKFGQNCAVCTVKSYIWVEKGCLWVQGGYLWVKGGYLWVKGGYLSVLGGYLGWWVNQVGGQDRWVGRSGGWVCQVAKQFWWVRKVGWVGRPGRFGLEGYKFKTINESMNHKGGHRAARAAKKYPSNHRKITLNSLEEMQFSVKRQVDLDMWP